MLRISLDPKIYLNFIGFQFNFFLFDFSKRPSQRKWRPEFWAGIYALLGSIFWTFITKLGFANHAANPKIKTNREWVSFSGMHKMDAQLPIYWCESSIKITLFELANWTVEPNTFNRLSKEHSNRFHKHNRSKWIYGSAFWIRVWPK